MDHSIAASILASIVLAGCAGRQEARPGPIAPGTPVLMVPVNPIGVEVIDEKAFVKMLEADDWSSVIDPTTGVVSLTENVNEKNPGIHEVSVHRFCGPRAAMWAKFEALDLAANMISESLSGYTPCLGFRDTDAPTLEIECQDRSGALKNFRFERRGSRLVLSGIAAVSEGSISPKDEQRYADALAAPDRCDPATGSRRDR